MTPDWRELYRRFDEFHHEFFVGRWRSGLQREAGRQQDTLMAMLFLEALGIPNPTSYYALEFYPEFVEEFHRWHQRMGMNRFPEPGICC